MNLLNAFSLMSKKIKISFLINILPLLQNLWDIFMLL